MKKFCVYGSGRTWALHPNKRFKYRGYRVTKGAKVELYSEGTPMATPNFRVLIGGMDWLIFPSKHLTKDEHDELLHHYWNAYSDHLEYAGELANDRYYELVQKLLDAFIDLTEKDLLEQRNLAQQVVGS